MYYYKRKYNLWVAQEHSHMFRNIFFVFVFLFVALSVAPFSYGATDTVSTSVDVVMVVNIGVTPETIDFGALTPGTPVTSTSGVVITVSTSAENGYLLGIQDDIAGTGSALLHTDGATRIADYLGTIATPTLWSGTGLGMSVYMADTDKEVKWGTGTTYNDPNNKYAGIPELFSTFHSSPGYKAGPDQTGIGFKMDAPNDQKVGNYSGNVIITATAIIL
jgi:hypothetical protein